MESMRFEEIVKESFNWEDILRKMIKKKQLKRAKKFFPESSNEDKEDEKSTN